jgi:hypothetical protein
LSLAHLSANAAAAARPPAKDGARGLGSLEKLWRTYPLRAKSQDEARLPRTPPRAEVGTRPQPAATRDGQSRRSLWIFSSTTLVLLAAAIVVVTLLSQARYRGGQMDKFRFTRSGDPDTKTDAKKDQNPVTEVEHEVVASRVTNYLGTGSDLGTGSEEASGSGARQRSKSRDFDRLGDHVSSVLASADEAAARIREEARQEAARVREQAQEEAAALANSALQDANATRADAEKLRSDAEVWSKQARTAADTFAADRRAEAEAEAKEIISAAEQQQHASLSEGIQRQQALETDISLAEERLRQLATGLHELAARLDGLLSKPLHAANENESAVGRGDSLVGALRHNGEPSRPRDGNAE